MGDWEAMLRTKPTFSEAQVQRIVAAVWWTPARLRQIGVSYDPAPADEAEQPGAVASTADFDASVAALQDQLAVISQQLAALAAARPAAAAVPEPREPKEPKAAAPAPDMKEGEAGAHPLAPETS